MVTGSMVEVLVTTTVKVKAPPGAVRVSGVAVLRTAITGTTLVSVTVAWSVSVTTVPAASWAVTVTVSVWDAPAGPVKLPGNVHTGVEAAGASTVPIRAPQVLPARVARSP